jgi:hypothetical protein
MTTDYWKLVDPVWDHLVQWDSPAEFLSAFSSTEVSARTLFAAHWLYSEVSNGGFHQFYWNSTGVLAPEAASAYEAIGMPRTANTVRQSMSWFPAPYPRERQTRLDLLNEYDEIHPSNGGPFRSLDDAFYEAAESENGGFVNAANAFASAQS